MTIERIGRIAILFIVLILLVGDLASTDRDVVGSDNGQTRGDEEPDTLHTSLDLLKRIDSVSIRTQTESSMNTHLLQHNDTLYYTYTWFNSSRTTVSMIASYDGGKNWTSAIDVWSSSSYSDCIWKEILIWKGDIYLIWFGYNTNSASRIGLMKKASLSNWQGLRTASSITIRGSYAHSFSVTHDQDYIYLALVKASQWDAIFYRYDGSSWSGGQVIRSGSGSNVEIKAVNTDSGTKLLFFFDRPYNTGYVYLRSSTNNGTTWSSITTVMNRGSDYKEMSLMDLNGTLLLFACEAHDDDIDLVISRNDGATWSSEKNLISNRNPSAYLFGKYGFSVASYISDNIILLAYEGGPDKIRMIYSRDWGSNWLSEADAITLHSPGSFNPMFCNNGKYLTYEVYTGSAYNVEIISLRGLYFEDFSPGKLSLQRGYLYNNVTWEPSPLEVFANYTFERYEIFRGTTQSNLQLLTSVGNVTHFNQTIISKVPIRYYYAVRAVFTDIGESLFSNMVSGELRIPPPVTNLTARPGDFVVNLSWNPVLKEVSDLYPVEKYTLHRGRYPDTLVPITNTYPSTEYEDQDVQKEPVTYYYNVTYVLQGIGEWIPSNMISAKPNTLPMPPIDLEFSFDGNNITLEWSPPEDTGNLPLTEFAIYRGSGVHDLTGVNTTSGSATTLSVVIPDPGEHVFYSVSASNRLGMSGLHDPILIEYRGAPSKPQNIIATGKDGTIELNWEPPRVTWDMDIENYQIYRGTSEEELRFLSSAGGDDLTFTDQVQNGVEYHYAVSAVNTLGEGRKAGPVSAIASGLPGPVGGISITVGDGSADIRWQEVLDDGGAPIIGYRIFRTVGGDKPEHLSDLPSGIMAYRDRGLVNGNGYFYWISAVNRNGEGDLLGPALALPGTGPGTINTIGGQGLLFHSRIWWDQPEDGGEDITAYNIYRGESAHSLDLLATISSNFQSGFPEFIDDGVDHGPIYYYSVSAVNPWGEGARSAAIPVKPLGAPTTPIVTHVNEGLDQFTIYWAPPLENGGEPIQGYHVYLMVEGRNEWVDLKTSKLFMEIDGLTPGSTTKVQISAFTQLTEGPRTDSVKVTVGTPPGRPKNINVVGGDRSCTISWSGGEDNGFPVTGYRVYMIHEGVSLLVGEVTGDILSFEYSGLTNGVESFYGVSGMNIRGEGKLSKVGSAIPMGLPGSPDRTWVEHEMENEVVIRWEKPGYDGGSPISGYSIYKGDNKGAETLLITLKGTDTYLDDEVVNGNDYYYFIRAENALGEGKPGSTIHAAPVGVPSKVVEYKIKGTSDTVSLSWEGPDRNGGADILGYHIYKGTHPERLELWKDIGPNTFKTEDHSVVSDTYYYRIVAVNKVGEGKGTRDSVDVPARSGSAVIIGISLFMMPLMIIILTLLAGFIIRRAGQRREERERERELQKEQEVTPVPALQPSAAPPPALPGMHSTMLPPTPRSRDALPPALVRPQQLNSQIDGYIRPLPGGGSRGKRTLLGTDGRPIGQEEQPPMPPPLSEQSPPVQPHPDWHDDMQKALESEANSVFVGGEPQQTEPEISLAGPPPSLEPEVQLVDPPPPLEPVIEEEKTTQDEMFHQETSSVWSPEMVENRVANDARSAVEMVHDLNRLREEGAITEEEFQIHKKRLLRKI